MKVEGLCLFFNHRKHRVAQDRMRMFGSYCSSVGLHLGADRVEFCGLDQGPTLRGEVMK